MLPCYPLIALAKFPIDCCSLLNFFVMAAYKRIVFSLPASVYSVDSVNFADSLVCFVMCNYRRGMMMLLLLFYFFSSPLSSCPWWASFPVDYISNVSPASKLGIIYFAGWPRSDRAASRKMLLLSVDSD